MQRTAGVLCRHLVLVASVCLLVTSWSATAKVPNLVDVPPQARARPTVGNLVVTEWIARARDSSGVVRAPSADQSRSEDGSGETRLRPRRAILTVPDRGALARLLEDVRARSLLVLPSQVAAGLSVEVCAPLEALGIFQSLFHLEQVDWLEPCDLSGSLP